MVFSDVIIETIRVEMQITHFIIFKHKIRAFQKGKHYEYKKINHPNTLMVAHRGLSGIETENTAAAFIAAGNRSYFGIETDVHLTADRKYIISHDSNTKRVSHGLMCHIEETSYDVLRNIPLKDKDGKARADLCLPSLDEYIKICKRYDKKCILEIKTDMDDDAIAGMIEIIEAQEYLDNVIFISFGYDNLVKIRKIKPLQAVQFLYGGVDREDIFQRLVQDKIDIDISHGGVTKEFIDKAHAHGLKINCWTVDDPQRGQELADMGVDFITTNILE